MVSNESSANFASIREKILSRSGKDYWRSVEEFVDAPEFEEFVKLEYPQQAEEWESSLSRRKFITVMGASLALAGLSGCVIQPEERIVPYVRQPEEIVPGRPLYFATAMTLGGVATGLLGRSNEGRPTKIEGNPEHPGSLGATDFLAQASLLDLYDPDRSQEVTYRGIAKTWENFVADLRAKVEENRRDGGAGIRFLTETITSPTLIAQFKQILSELPNARWYQYEPLNKDNSIAGAKMSFGSAAQPVYRFDQATRILALDADFFSGFNVRYLKDFAKQRAFSEEKKEMNRVYAVETTLTMTGAKADHRLAVKPSQMTEIVKAIAKAIGVPGANSNYSENAKWIEALAKDLLANKGKSLVIAGDNQPPIVHAIANAMNSALENIGTTVAFIEPLQPNAETLQHEGLRELLKDIDSGNVKLLAIFGGNPVYNTPSDLKLSAERIEKIPMRVHLGRYADETAELCHWHAGEKHFLEMWSDARAYDGTVSIVQPLVKALYDGKSAHEFLQLFAKEKYDQKDYDLVRANWSTKGNPLGDGDFEKNWRKAVHDGIIAGTASPLKTVSVNTAFLSQPETKPASSGDLEISILPDPCVYDGRFANNGWLQELPNPLTKITWENVALISPATAAKLGVNQTGRNRDAEEQAGGGQGTAFWNTKGGNLFSDLATLKVNGVAIEKPVPMWIQPGQPDDVVTIFLGYGRKRAGRIGSDIGYNAYDVRRSDASYFANCDLSLTGEKTTVASTQTHFNMEGRDVLRVWDVEQFEQNPTMGHQHDEYPKSMYPYEEFEKLYAKNHRWGMTIDLNSCVGCNACVLACQSENNIPVVGKEQVEKSREMHWMRIDAYYGGSEINQPDGLYFQPLLCQQCEQAPCETVCPVHATVHSAEGLNDMVYNRCVGTRYCSNNCPYKVRRFNFLLYQDWNTPQYKLMRNPEVTIRSRGVMEKCTYCTQRIAAARIEAEKDGRRVRDGEVVTACQSVCPTEAIVFGDINDETSRVAKLKKDHRDYKLLNELNTQPRTSYLAALKNQNKEMPDYIPPKPIEKEEGESASGENKREAASESH